MKRGRKPKPSSLKLLAGNPGKRAVSPGPDYPKGWPEMPAFLATDPEACAEWERVSAQLRKADVVRPIDAMLLAGYCSAVGRAIRASEGAAVFTARVGEANRCWEVVRHYAALFGIGPAERGRVSGAAAPKPNARSLLA